MSKRMYLVITLGIVLVGQCARISAPAQTAAAAAALPEEKPRLIVQLGHQLPVHALAFSPEGKRILTGSDLDGTVCLWDIETGGEIRRFKAHSSFINSVAFSADGQFLLTGGADGSACLWNAATGTEVWRYRHLNDSLANMDDFTQASFAPNPKYILVHIGFHLHICDAATGKQVATIGDELAKYDDSPATAEPPPPLKVPKGLVVGGVAGGTPKSSGKRILATALSTEGYRLLYHHRDGTLHLTNMTGDKEFWSLKEESEPVHFEALSPDGRLVLISNWEPADADYTGERAKLTPRKRKDKDITLRLIDATTGKEVQRFGGFSPTHISPVQFTRAGRFLLTGNPNSEPEGALCMWDIATGKVIKRFKGRPERYQELEIKLRQNPRQASEIAEEMAMLDGSENIEQAVFSPDERFILTGSFGGGVRLWDVATGGEMQAFRGYGESSTPLGTFSEGPLLAIRRPNEPTRLWYAATDREVLQIQGSLLATSSDGSFALDQQEDQLRLWNVTTGSELQHFAINRNADKVNKAFISRDGTFVLTVDNDHRVVSLWDARTGNRIQQFTGHTSPIQAVAMSSDGQFLVTSSGNFARIDEYNRWIPDEDAALRLWNAKTGKQIRELHRGFIGFVSAIALSTKEPLILAYATHAINENVVNLVNINSPQESKRIEFKVNEASAEVGEFSPDGRALLVRSGTNIYLTDVQTGAITARLSHAQDVWGAVFSPDGQFVISKDSTDTTYLWNRGTGQELCRLIIMKDGTWVIVDPEGRFDTNNLEEIRGLHWIMPDEPLRPLPLEIFMRDYYEPRLLSRLLNGEQFKPIRRLSELNRVQPQVKITSIQPQKDRPERVTVTVEVAKGTEEFNQEHQKITRQTGVYDLRLFRDGQLVGYAPQPSGNAPGEINLDASGMARLSFPDIRLPQRRRGATVEFSAYAFNADRIKSATTRQKYTLPSPLTLARGRAYLISFGVNRTENPVWNLRFAANDARLTQSVLARRLAESQNYEEVVAVPLISDDLRDGQRTAGAGNATKANFRAVLELLAGKSVSAQLKQLIPNAERIRKATPEDTVIITFASHGYTDAQGIFYLIPSDIGGASSKLADVLPRCISSDELALWLRDMDAGELLLVIDACHSAAAVQGQDFKPGPMGSRGLGQLAYDKGMRILAATQADNVALELGGLGHGLLTYALVRDGIDAGRADYRPRDGMITVREWLEYGQKRVPELYAEVGQGKRALLLNGRAVSGMQARGAIVSGQAGKKAGAQQPQLFDFTRQRAEVVLVKNQ